MELYPRIGKSFDIKVFTNCRFGMMSWAVLSLTYCIKQVSALIYFVGRFFLGSWFKNNIFFPPPKKMSLSEVSECRTGPQVIRYHNAGRSIDLPAHDRLHWTPIWAHPLLHAPRVNWLTLLPIVAVWRNRPRQRLHACQHDIDACLCLQVLLVGIRILEYNGHCPWQR